MKHGIYLTLTFLFSTLCLAAAPKEASEVNPLEVGASIPDASLRTVTGDAVQLRELVSDQPTLIVFYRGSWCPYCNRHLSEIQEIEDTLVERGYQILAISPDRPANLKEAVEKNDLRYQVLSDSEAEAAKAFGLAFKVDKKTRQKYQSYGIDLEKASGESHFLLPVPAVYLTDQDGKITFRHYNPNYQNRLSAERMLEAAQ